MNSSLTIPTKTQLAALAEQIRECHSSVVELKAKAVNRALYLGALLNEAKEIVGHGPFMAWRKKEVAALSDDNCERYMKMSANVVRLSGVAPLELSISSIVGAAAEDLPNDAAREAQQLLFAFTADKTIKDCLAAVVVDGDEPHRITRAANGKTKGGTRGEDRKDFPKFIGVHLSDISAHLKSWSKFTPQQAEEVLLKYGSHFGKCPTTLLGQLKTLITDELKTR